MDPKVRTAGFHAKRRSRPRLRRHLRDLRDRGILISGRGRLQQRVRVDAPGSKYGVRRERCWLFRGRKADVPEAPGRSPGMRLTAYLRTSTRGAYYRETGEPRSPQGDHLASRVGWQVTDGVIGTQRPGLVTIRYTAAITSTSAIVPIALSIMTRCRYRSEITTCPLADAAMSLSIIAFSLLSSGMK